jgi:hypothetical protein
MAGPTGGRPGLGEHPTPPRLLRAVLAPFVLAQGYGRFAPDVDFGSCREPNIDSKRMANVARQLPRAARNSVSSVWRTSGESFLKAVHTSFHFSMRSGWWSCNITASVNSLKGPLYRARKAPN